MKKQNLVLGGILLGGCLAVVACSSDGDDSSSTGGSGSGGGSAGSAGTHAGGEAGATPSAEGGEAGSTGGSGGGGFMIAANLDPTGILIPTAAPLTNNHLLVAGTDYKTTEVASITLAPAAVGDSTVYMDGDSVPVSSGGIGFVLERTNDKVHLLDGGTVKTTFDVTDAGTDTAPLAKNKAYVTIENRSFIPILDLTAGTVSRRIDLSQFDVATDTDGSVDVSGAAYDATKKIAYFALARIDRNAIATDPNYHLPCASTSAALIVGIDTTTDALVDLNGAAAGLALELSLIGPQSVAIDATGTKLTVLSEGCYDGAALKKSGVEVVDLTLGTTTTPYAPTGTDSLANLILLGGNNALLDVPDDNFVDHWFKLDLGTGTRGVEIPGVPASPIFDGTDLLGVNVTGNVGSVVRYSITLGTSTTITATSWAGKYGTAYGTALVP